ncbi:MAG: hypothetical protein FJX59_17455 [Alphaproteobacteria bacterium]|nr:hypothetical protein [Alphaproteobacteria bacterium]
MTEVVTIKVAQDAQQNLFALRPQVSADNDNNQTQIQISQAEVESDVRRKPTAVELGGDNADQDAVYESAKRDSRSELTGPSRARIVLRDFDVGKTPAEVVGTRDVVLRFDSNADGRIDLIESQRSARARSDGTSFQGLAASPVEAAPLPTPTAEASPNRPRDAAPLPVEPRQSFGTDAAGDVITQKKYVQADEVQASGEPPQKYFGKGAEAAVVAQFASPAATDAPQKYSDRAAQLDRGTLSEEGSGERKFYDKVAESDTDTTGGEGDPAQQRTYYERSQQLAGGEADTDIAPPAQKKYGPYGPIATVPAAPQGHSTAHIQVTA